MNKTKIFPSLSQRTKRKQKLKPKLHNKLFRENVTKKYGDVLVV